MDKQAIRDSVRVLRETQSEAMRAGRSAIIQDNLLSLACLSPENVKDRKIALFYSCRGEPDTLGIHAALSGFGAQCYFPAVTGGAIRMRRVPGSGERAGSFRPGGLGIPEPDGPDEEQALMDMVIIPGIAFSPSGSRIGYGKGYYDRYLASYPPDRIPILIAPAFDFQILTEIEPSPHDVPVDIIVTESRILHTGIREAPPCRNRDVKQKG